jgi:hypothetical protein
MLSKKGWREAIRYLAIPLVLIAMLAGGYYYEPPYALWLRPPLADFTPLFYLLGWLPMVCIIFAYQMGPPGEAGEIAVIEFVADYD